MPDPAAPAPPARPAALPDRVAADGGPRYAETPADPAAFAARVAEPYNAATAAVFVLLVAFWAGRLWGRFARYPFVSCCLPVLLAGGVGGTLYHMYRSSSAYFLLDVVPIQLLGLAGSAYMTVRLVRLGVRGVGAAVAGTLAALGAVNLLFRSLPAVHPNLAVNLSYASLAVLILAPVAGVLVKTGFRHAGWVAGGLASFAIAWFCRLVDREPWVRLPMGTHWLWHLFGAVATSALIEYYYRVEGGGREGTDPRPAV